MEALLFGLSQRSSSILREQLMAHGYTVRSAKSTDSFMDALSSDPDLVVLGGYNCSSVARIARGRLGTTPIVAVMPQRPNELPEVDDYLFEPLNPVEVRVRVSRLGRSPLLPDIKGLTVAFARLHAGALALEHLGDADVFKAASADVQIKLRGLLNAAGLMSEQAHRAAG